MQCVLNYFLLKQWVSSAIAWLWPPHSLAPPLTACLWMNSFGFSTGSLSKWTPRSQLGFYFLGQIPPKKNPSLVDMSREIGWSSRSPWIKILLQRFKSLNNPYVRLKQQEQQAHDDLQMKLAILWQSINNFISSHTKQNISIEPLKLSFAIGGP